LERDVKGVGFQPGVATPLAGLKGILNLVDSHKDSNKWIARTQISFAPTPTESAVELLVQKLGCMPLMAAVYFAAIADRVGNLSDDNGERESGDFLSLSVSDLEREIEKLAGVLSVTDLDSAFQRGLCEPVDFLTPLNDANFYLGKDVQPGHLAAGLLSERPDARARVLNALERQRAVLIAGPSGSGKSGLMWEAARESRHTIRWFRIRSAAESDIVELLRLADSFRATAHMPIGFVLDDVGRNRTGLWNVLATEAATRPNVLLLGSLREEDMFLVTRRSLSTEIREQPDTGLAERIWQELKERRQTSWPGWREPWQNCNGLLLEYTHLLTQDRRLWDVLRDQVDRRVREKRRDELAVLRVTSTAGQTGGTIDLTRLRHALAINDDDLSDALRRLIDEHLIQRVKSGERLASLHQIRAAALAEITHETPPPLKVKTVEQAVVCVAPGDLEGFIARTLAREPALVQGILTGAVERMREDGCLTLLASIVRGLDTGSIGNTVERWLPHLDRLGIPPTQAPTVAMFAVANTEPFVEEKLKAHFEAAQLLREMAHNDHRWTMLDRLEPHWPMLLTERPDWRALTEFLAALLGTQLSPTLEIRLLGHQPDLLSMPLDEAVELLETAGLVAPKLATTWVDKVGQALLLARLARETPWISSPELRNEPEGLAVCADVFHISDRLQSDLHGDVVTLCRKLFAFAPSADLVVSSAIAPDGEPAGIGGVPVATKRIPRTNLPAGALPVRNNRWIAAVAQSIAPDGMSQYLAEARRLFDELIHPLQKLIDLILRGKTARGKATERYLDTLGSIYEASRNLTRPIDPDDTTVTEKSAIGVSELQNILQHCSTDLLRGLSVLPEQHAASYMVATDILKRIDRARIQEPWGLIGDDPPASLVSVREIVDQVRMIIGEAGFRNLLLRQLAPNLAKSTPSNDLLRKLSLSLKRQVDSRLESLTVELEASVRERGYFARTSARPINEIGGPWPYAEVLVVLMLERLADWFTALDELPEPLRELSGPGRLLIVLPAVAGFSIPDLAISGVATLFPKPFNDVSWLEEIGLPPAEIPVARTFDAFVTALLEASAISVFGCGGEERSAKEATALAEALETIQSTRTELECEISAEERGQFLELLDQFVAMGPNLAIAFWQHMRGSVDSPAIIRLTALKLLIVDANMSSSRKREGNQEIGHSLPTEPW